MLEIIFLGTGTSQGIPVIGSKHPVCLSQNKKDKRLRVSISISWKNKTYIIDCGPDFRQQMLNNSISKIDGILFTHEHADHSAGLDDIRPFFFKYGNIPIYAHKRVLKALKKRFNYIFDERRPGDKEFVIADNKKALKTIGFKNTRGLEEMCRDGWNWQMKNPNGYG